MSKEAFKAWYKSEYGIEPCTVNYDKLFHSPTWTAWQHLSTAITKQQEEIERLRARLASRTGFEGSMFDGALIFPCEHGKHDHEFCDKCVSQALTKGVTCPATEDRGAPYWADVKGGSDE